MPVSPEASICAGDSATFEAEIVTDVDQNDLTTYWQRKGGSNVKESAHFSMSTNVNETVLDVHYALPSHSGVYEAFAYRVDNDNNVFKDQASFTLEVHGKIIIIWKHSAPFSRKHCSPLFAVCSYYRNLYLVM